MIPPLLAEQVADSEQLAAHRKLVERVEKAAAKVCELRAAHKQAVETHREAEQAFAAGKRAKLPPPRAPAAAEAVEQAERELELLTRQLPASADELWVAAYPHVEEALRRLDSLVDEGDEEVERHIGEARESRREALG